MIAGAVLCGGASRRMRTDKALLVVEGRLLAERVAAAVEEAGCRPVVFVGGDQASLAATGRPFVADRWPGQGPVGGILTALLAFGADGPGRPDPPGGPGGPERARVDGVVVAACDLVDLTPAAVRAVMAGAGPPPAERVTMADSGRPEPLLAYWPLSAAAGVAALFPAVRAVHELASRLGAQRVAVAPAALRNVNRPGDLPASVAPVPVPEISTDELAACLADGARVIDVRQADEYAAGHVPGAESVPLATVADHYDLFASDGPTYLICATGRRSMLAAEMAATAGLATVNVAGGTVAWVESGRPVVTGTSPS